jgi:hypothetical protein
MLGGTGDIIRAEGALCGLGISSGGIGIGLSRRSDTLEFMAEVLKVFRADLQLQYFFDHRREVCQGADRSQRRGTGGPDESPYCSQHEGVLNRLPRPCS